MTQGEGTLEMLATALRMEEKGRAFYEKAVSTCTSALGKDVFRMLMEAEVKHIERIKRIHETLQGGKGWPQEKPEKAKPRNQDLDVIFREMARKHGPKAQSSAGDIEALGAGLELEESSIAYYGNAAPKAKDPLERKFLDALVSEEKDHWATLTDMKSYLTDPAAWFQGRERGGLDGA